MEFQLNHRQGRLLASGDMTIYQAARMKDAWLASWAQCGPDVQLDLASVTELDTCGLQVLLALRKRAAIERRQLTIVAASAAVSEILELCGLTSLCAAEQAGV